MPMDGHHEPFVVVVPVPDELPPSAFVGDGADEVLEVEPVVVEEVLPPPLARAVELVGAAFVVDGVEAAPVAELIGVAGAAPAATAVAVLFDAYASARCSPRPPTARVELSSTPAVQRRVRRSATFTWRGLRRVMDIS
ncbi:MAG: hypothetical protein ACOYBY_06725 [Dermatophilaceae bacterium]